MKKMLVTVGGADGLHERISRIEDHFSEIKKELLAIERNPLQVTIDEEA